MMFSSQKDLAVSALADIMGLHSTGKTSVEVVNGDHRALCALGANWLVRNHKCRAVLVERGGAGNEMPDVIGFHYQDSFLIEAKTSRADFLADKNKSFRVNPETGMGKYRYYICPKGLINPDEVPENWGLLYVSPKGRISKIIEAHEQEYAKDLEYLMLTSALAAPWKLFQHWSKSALEHLFKIRWVSPNTEVDVKMFAARIIANRLEEKDNG